MLMMVMMMMMMMLRPAVIRPACLGVGHPFGAYDQILFFCRKIAWFLMWVALSDERTGL
jgi:hypothetical protein